MPSLSIEDYTVGWICALPEPEWKASRVLLDEEHDTVPLGWATKHQYVYGSMNGHNVVMGCLPAEQLGKASAAAVASEMGSTFPSLRFGLLVGVGGGVLGAKDVRLGDIIISLPDRAARHGGVVQYDYGKAVSGGLFEHMGVLNQPPEILLSAIGKVKSAPRKHSRFIAYLNEGFEDEPEFLERPQSDTLFCAEYVHPEGQTTCLRCDTSQEVERLPRKSTDPVIHYGTIASGDQVMKDAAKRDEISKHVGGVLCFEMEAAGLMNRFPCIVVRGICDYCDSHKNEDWQPIAAAAAAAWAKELLRNIAPAEMQSVAKISDVLEGVNEIVSTVRNYAVDDQATKVRDWLAPVAASTNYTQALSKRQEGTGQWFLYSEEYQQWKQKLTSALWLYGIPGCGKSVLSATIIEDLLHCQKTSEDTVLYFYFDFNNTAKQTWENMLRTLLFDLYVERPHCRMSIDRLYSACRNGNEQPQGKTLEETLHSLLSKAHNIYIVVDALDECKVRKEMLLSLKWFEQGGAQVLVTSRKERDIEASLTSWVSPSCIIPIQQKAVDNDIRAVVRNRLIIDDDFQRWQLMPEARNRIEQKLMKKAHGLFRWATCQLDVLAECLDLPSLERALSTLPDTLRETYDRILSNIPDIHRPHATRLLQFLAFAERPLQLDEAIDVLAVFPDRTPAFEECNRMPSPLDIARCCSSLTVITSQQEIGDSEGTNRRSSTITKQEIRLSHTSVKEYLVSGRIEESFRIPLRQLHAEAEIVRVSLAYLFTAAHRSEMHSPSDVGSLQATLPLLQFCAQHWTTHARNTEQNAYCGQSLAIDVFTKPNLYCFWLSVYDPDRPWSSNLDLPSRLPEPIYYTSLCGLLTATRLLIERGDDVNAEGGYYGRALQAASARGHAEVVQLLLNRGAKINAEVFPYNRALQAASEGGHAAVVLLLLNNGANIDAEGWPVGNALQAAIHYGHTEVVQQLLNKGADVNAQSGVNGNALYAASITGQTEVVEQLLDRGAKINAEGGEYGSALQAASKGGYTELVQLLLNKGANVNAKTWLETC